VASSPVQRPSLEVYLFDTSSLINLEDRNKLSLLNHLGDRARVPYFVAKEINKSTRKSDLKAWLQRNQERVVRFIKDEGTRYYELLQQVETKIGEGEAAAIAIAIQRGWTLVIDDMPARKKANSHGCMSLDLREFLDVPAKRVFF